ncbi:hypothetical protein [Agrobacterium sp. ST15.13.015]|uniref:hypothetical protein n=1 Tax=Agrobacterium sp. ST15.13.015 TaxID=3017319 RepID=UPI0022BDF211|nr:hypothetical protein [Agrobacterium sp. ST15.13.015]MCZ7500839.1 hypothetical protein [Rhizobium rhizogenes]
MELQRKWDLEDRDEAREYSRDVYKNLVIDAEEAGFNPLTALRNGGGANYNAAAAFAPLSRKAPVKQAVGGSVAGDAFDALGDFITDFDPFKDQKREQEYRLIESQISALNASALSGAPRGTASYATGGLERRVSGQGGALAQRKGNAPGEGTIVGGDDPSVSSFGWNDGKYGYFHAPWMPDAEVNEKINGDNEAVSLLYSVGKVANDWGYSLYRNAKSGWGDASDAWQRAKRKAERTAAPQTRHQADPGSWMDFAPKAPKVRW